jgi:hypothetical protein
MITVSRIVNYRNRTAIIYLIFLQLAEILLAVDTTQEIFDRCEIRDVPIGGRRRQPATNRGQTFARRR